MQLYHKTHIDNIPSIKKEGLQTGHAVCKLENPKNYCNILGKVYEKFDAYKDRHNLDQFPYRSQSLFFFAVLPIEEQNKKTLVVNYQDIKQPPSNCQCYAGIKEYVDLAYRDIEDGYYENIGDYVKSYFKNMKPFEKLGENDDLYDYEIICSCEKNIPPSKIQFLS